MQCMHAVICTGLFLSSCNQNVLYICISYLCYFDYNFLKLYTGNLCHMKLYSRKLVSSSSITAEICYGVNRIRSFSNKII